MKRFIIGAVVFATALLCNPAHAKTVAKDTVNGYTIKVTQSKGKTKIYWNGKKIRQYRFAGKVKIVDERKLTAKKLINRKNKVLYIEKCTGVVTDRKLNGRRKLGYISYRSLKGKVRKGDYVVTYLVYNPHTSWIDDIAERYDVPLK